jgi:hypothetical protein
MHGKVAQPSSKFIDLPKISSSLSQRAPHGPQLSGANFKVGVQDFSAHACVALLGPELVTHSSHQPSLALQSAAEGRAAPGIAHWTNLGEQVNPSRDT